MNSETEINNKPKYLNPYFGGVLLGLLLLAVIYIAGRGLSATGALKLSIATMAETISPTHVENNSYLSKFIPEDGSSP